MTKNDLMPFCSTDPYWPQLAEPFSWDEWSFATNAAILVRVPRLAEVPETPEAPSLAGLKDIFLSAWRSETPAEIPAEIPSPQVKECKLCDGKGRLRVCVKCHGEGRCICPSCDDDHECRACEGLGRVPERNGPGVCDKCHGAGTIETVTPVRVGIVLLADKYLRLLRALPNVRVYTNGPRDMVRFVFDGGDGVVMPMRES